MSEVTTLPAPAKPALLSSGRTFTTPEVMGMFGYEDSTSFWQAVRRAGVPFVRVSPRRAIFRERDLETWMESRTRGGKRR